MFKWLKDWGEEVKDKFQAVVPGYFGGDWYTEGWQASPLGGFVMADTKALPAGIYKIRLMNSSDANLSVGFFTMQHRNAANDTTIKEQYIGSYSATESVYDFGLLKFRSDERFRVIVRSNVTGNVQFSIFGLKCPL